MAIRLATTADIAALRALYAEQHEERVALYGSEVDIDGFRDAWQAGNLRVFVVAVGGNIRAALFWYHHEGVGWEWVSSWWSNALSAVQVRENGGEAIRHMASLVPPETAIWGRAPKDSFWERYFEAAAARLGGFEVREREVNGRLWVRYRTRAGNLAGL